DLQPVATVCGVVDSERGLRQWHKGLGPRGTNSGLRFITLNRLGLRFSDAGAGGRGTSGALLSDVAIFSRGFGCGSLVRAGGTPGQQEGGERGTSGCGGGALHFRGL